MNAAPFEHFVRPEWRVWDEGTMHEVITQDCYRIDDYEFDPEDVVIDIGANIGFFSGYVAAKGCKHVVAVEASPMNYKQLVKNVVPMGVHCLNAAVWRSDELPSTLRLSETVPDGNTGGISVIHNTGEVEVHTIPLDALMATYTKVRYLKVDCEGSEYPILMTSQQLDKVQEIAIEVHPIHSYDSSIHTTLGGLVQSLVYNHFKVQVEAREGMEKGWAYIWANKV